MSLSRSRCRPLDTILSIQHCHHQNSSFSQRRITCLPLVKPVRQPTFHSLSTPQPLLHHIISTTLRTTSYTMKALTLTITMAALLTTSAHAATRFYIDSRAPRQTYTELAWSAIVDEKDFCATDFNRGLSFPIPKDNPYYGRMVWPRDQLSRDLQRSPPAHSAAQ